MSRPTRDFAVYGFESTHRALDAEKLLDDMGVDVVPIPTPAAIGARCGIALRVPVEESARASEYLERAGIGVAATMRMQDI